MGLLKKPYEISLWEDEWDSLNKKFDETRTLTIGSSEMEYPGRAIEPNLVRKTNGEVSFSFKMYYQFVDTTTGETVNNPFVDYIANETKIKLKYGDEWFDLLVKNVRKDSATKSCTYQLVDQHMTELSKNGFDVQLDSKLFNNLDTAEGLGLKVLQNTDWGVESEKIVQTQDEALVMLKVSTEGGIQAYQINDTNLTENGAMPAATTTTIPKDACIYAFYSSCSGEKPYRFQFIYKKTDRGEGKNPRYVYDSFEIQSDRIIADQNCQYYIDGITEWVESSGFTIPKDFAIDTRETSLDGINNKSAISVLYRGRRYVYSQTSEYHPGLDIYLEKYEGAVTNAVDGYFKYGASEAVWKSWGKLGTQDTWSYYTDGHKPEDEKMFPVGTIVKVENSETSYKPIYLLVTNSLIQSEAESGPRYYYEAIVIDNTSTQYYKYTKTEYVAPSLIQNVVNNAEFKGTSAWKGSKFLTNGDTDIGGKPASSPEFSATVESVSMKMTVSGQDNISLTNATDAMLSGQTVIGDTNYKPYLLCGNLHQENDGDITKVITNSGTSDTAAFQQGVTEGEKYHLVLKSHLIRKRTRFNADGTFNQAWYDMKWDDKPTDITAQVTIGNYEYKSVLNGYNSSELSDSFDGILYNSGEIGLDVTIDIEAEKTVNPENMKKDDYQMFLRFSNVPESDSDPVQRPSEGLVKYEYFILIEKIQFYKLYPKGENSHYTPDDDMSSTEVSYVVEDRYFPVIENDTRTLDEITFAPTTNVFTPVLSADGSKKSTVNVKESNYFNAIQAIASTFECWPQLEVNHDATGKIVNFPGKNYSKRVHFKNYVGQKNHVGFKYGVNSKDIKRTLDSNQIVSKLIVKANSNEYAPNGFCTIARAPANSIKDNVLYNFDYYVRQQMLNATALQNDLHIADNLDAENLEEALRQITLLTEDEAGYVLASCTGYYPKMRLINQKLENLQKLIAEKNTPLIAETATYNTYKAMYEAAVSDLEEQQDRFFKLAGCAYNAIPDNKKQEVMNSTTLFSTLQTIAELSATEQDAKAKYEAAEENMEAYSSAILTLENQQKNAILLKKVLNNMFYTRYSRFIQEGTWIDESYLDESLYYNDALSVSYNSAMPKVTYSMNVLSLAGLPGYELFDFKVGDQTFVEDTEFFGYDTTGTPIRAEVTITQTSENLDDPTRNTIQIRNYENQFEDLFQRINATVQSVQYSEGSYKKAAEFVEADAAHKFSFLNDALSAAEAYIGDTNNTVVVDTSGGTGITITDKNNAEQALRLTSGAILLKGTNPDTGEKVWKTGLTAEGISASLINAGILNTGEINIMNGSEPTFRWDTHGITAYNFDNSTSDTFFGIDKTKGVRFDRFGLYGYEGINGESWHPSGIDNIHEYATFALTWKGLRVNHLDSYVHVGVQKDDDSELTRLISISDGQKETFFVDGNGNVTMRGNLMIGVEEEEETTEITMQDYIANVKTEVKTEAKEYADGWMNVDGNFSWKFDKNFGFTMWSGEQKPENIVFQFGKQNGENVQYMNGTGVFDGRIVANEGYIGGPKGWVINTGYIGSSTAKGSFYMASAGNVSNYWIRAHSASNSGGSRTFSVSKTGQLYASGANISGTLTATSGYIGPSGNNSFKIEEMTMTSSGTKYLAIHRGLTYNSSGAYYSFADGSFPMVLCPHGVESKSDLVTNCSASKYWVFLAGKVTSGVVPFGITDTGELYASAGNIAGWTIGATGLTKGTIGSSGCVHLYPSGYQSSAAVGNLPASKTWTLVLGNNFGVTTNGELYAKAGEIASWKIQDNGLVYGTINSANSIALLPTGKTLASVTMGSSKILNTSWKILVGQGFGVTTNGNVHAADATLDAFRLYTTSTSDGATSYLKSTDSQIVIKQVPAYNIFELKARDTDKTGDGYCDTELKSNCLSIEQYFNGYDGSHESYVGLGVDPAGTKSMSSVMTLKQNPGLCFYSKRAYNEYWPRGQVLIWFDEYGRLRSNLMTCNVNVDQTAANSDDYYYSKEDWLTYYGTLKIMSGSNFTEYKATGQAVGSDRRLKENIKQVEEDYDVMYDSLMPKTYRYKLEDKTHFGFIAQDVFLALNKAGKNPDDFEVLDVLGTNGLYGLHYDEFIALNTWQIQKLKPRMTAAEQEIASLKLEIQQLRAELEALK